METVSLLVVALFLLLTLALGFRFARRAHRSAGEYFLSGRNLPWWVLGTSMVVTTFAPDTPLGVAEYTRGGVYNAWFGWNMVMAQVLAVFLFSRLWRRSGVTTDNELIEIRYSGRPAAALRLFKALHFSLLMNLLSLALVIHAVVTVLGSVMDLEYGDIETLRFGLVAFALFYALLAGFWGVVATDFLQFWVAVAGTAAFAWLAADHIGGMGALKEAVAPDTIAFFPPDGSDRSKVVVYMTVMWWGMYNADGGGYLAQRMLAAKDERHASLGTLWFSVAYAAVRMWPWILIGTLSLLAFPRMGIDPESGRPLVNGRLATSVTGTIRVREEGEGGSGEFREVDVSDFPVAAGRIGERDVLLSGPGAEIESIPGATAYPRMMLNVLRGHPVLKGLLIAAFIAAFLSTVDTLLNWGGSYLSHDVYRRFLRPAAGDRESLWFAKGAMVLVMLAAVFLSRGFMSIRDAWIFIWAVTAGLGPAVILRWLWWRVNAWCEFGAMFVSIALTALFEGLHYIHDPAAYRFASPVTFAFGIEVAQWQRALAIVFGSLLATLAIAFLGRPADRSRLVEFARRVRPPGVWGPVRAEAGAESFPELSAGQTLLRWAGGVLFVYGCTFAIGAMLYGKSAVLGGALLAAAAGGVFIWRAGLPDARRG